MVAVTDILTAIDARGAACPPIVNGAKRAPYLVDGRLAWCDRYGPASRCPCRRDFVTRPCTAGHWWPGRGGGYWWCNGDEGEWRSHARRLIHVEVPR